MAYEDFFVFPAFVEVADPAAVLAAVNRIAKDTGAVIVLFDAEKMAGPAHVKAAAAHAVRSFATGKPVARTLAMEMLVYASGQRQCSLAPRFGLHGGRNFMYVLIAGGDRADAERRLTAVVQRETSVPTASPAVLMKEFGITAEELEIVGPDRIAELVVERVALLDAYR